MAIEINSNYKLPRLAFLRMAKIPGAKLSLGSNIRRARHRGILGTAKMFIDQLELKPKHIFQPAKPGAKPIQIRKI